jgi:hypothetical protein
MPGVIACRATSASYHHTDARLDFVPPDLHSPDNLRRVLTHAWCLALYR